MIDRDEPLTPEPPPVPAHHPAGRNRIREALELAVRFYVELLGSLLGLVLLRILLLQLDPVRTPVLLAVAAAALGGACLVRLTKRLIAARKKGRAPWQATATFFLALLLPAAGIQWAIQKYRAEEAAKSAPQQEAGNILLDAYRAEKSFFKEFGRYTYNIKELGLEPREGAKYVLGFPAACTVKYSVPGAKPTWDLLDFSLSQPRRVEVADAFRNFRNAEDCVDPKEGFELYAVASLRNEGPLDVWRIDSSRKLEHVQKGF